MLTLISPEEMRTGEQRWFASSGIPSIEFMERAARALADALTARFDAPKRVYFACGPGGNGGDGYACARLYQAAGREITLFSSAPARSPDARKNLDRALEAGLCVHPAEELSAFPAPEVWVDALYGTGLSRAPEGGAKELIERMNLDRAHGAKMLSADIPSGLNGRSGAAYTPCVFADLTLSFQFAKTGHFLQDGLDACPHVEIADLGFPGEAFDPALPKLMEPGDLRAHFAPRPRQIHKGSCGHLLIVAGSVGMAGAAALAVRAALRGGAGLVTLACPHEIVPIVQVLAPSAMCLPLPSREGIISPKAVQPLEDAFAGKSAIAIGCGLTRRAPAEVIASVLDSGLPAVIDADALNLIALFPALQSQLKPRHILTPHPGEAARLIGREMSDPISDARALSDLGATAVLKGASRVIAGAGESYLSASGSCGMARGGSGDVFTGLMGALIAEPSGRTPAQTAAVACELHGLAGELAQQKYGPRAMNSSDLIEFLPEVFQKYVD